MSDCHDLFFVFHKTITLSKSKKDILIKARNALRGRIKAYFKENLKIATPLFHSQGSYPMLTIITPLNGEYDIDDGVYLQNINKSNRYEWSSAETVHKWIYDSVDGHTDEKPVDKRTCIRVVYAGQYHVDLPIYGEYSEQYYLAEKSTGWRVSDPKMIRKWFADQVEQKGDQLIRIVKYIKAWADYKSNECETLSSIILTVLASDCYEEDERDDVALLGTMQHIYERIVTSFVVLNPVDAQEDLAKALKEEQKDKFKIALQILLQKSSEAINEENSLVSSNIWRKQFGERFPKADKSISLSFESILKDASHKEAPKWQMNLIKKVKIDAYVYAGGNNSLPKNRKKLGGLNTNGRRISSGLWMRFVAATNVDQPYDVYWQVVNTGDHAAIEGGLRGQIFKSDKGLIQWERTLYTGKHWIECFVVKNGECLAKSGQFIVNIKNPEY